ncbi:MAG: tRNA 2-thiouridine(34) synthase MnmA [Pseudanabaenaceae cyanobacterium]
MTTPVAAAKNAGAKNGVEEPRPRIVVGLSGGVDSSTAAALLCEQGYDVVGLTLWLMKGKGQCCSEGMVDAARICAQLGIPHEVIDSRETFAAHIVNYLVTGYQDGITPLPCSRCNRSVKFGPMVTLARERFGIDTIATGHYARLRFNPETGRTELHRARDRQKDQSYFLYEVGQEELAHCRFPLGERTKAETRAIAARLGLATAAKPESQDLCLIEAHGSMRDFLDRYIAQHKGKFVDTQGRVLGEHNGYHHFTIGQRKGLGIAAPQPLYVLAIHPGKNEVVVGERHEALRSECTVAAVNWVSIAPTLTPFRAAVQVRYRAEPAAAEIIPTSATTARIVFDEPQFAIAPGQAAVWYDGDRVLGGGILQKSEESPCPI